MLKKPLIVLSLSILGSLSALAIHSDANCDEWSTFYDPLPASEYTVTTTLWLDVNGVYQQVQQKTIYLLLEQEGPFLVSSAWDGILATGSYRATYKVDVLPLGSPYGYSVDLLPAFFDCVNTTSYIDARTPGYWKNHPEAWPVSQLSLGNGGLSYDQSCLLDVLTQPTRGDIRVKLLHHLIAAKLNLLNGSDPTFIVETIASADNNLTWTNSLTGGCADPFLQGDKPKGADKHIAEALKDSLDAYNNNLFSP